MLDPAGLAHAFAALGISIDDLALRRVDDVYEVEADGAAPVRIFADLGATVERLERDHRGQGVRYRKLVAAVTKVHRALAPLQVKARPSPLALIRAGAAWHAPFLLRSLAGVLAGAGLRGVVAEAVGTWTHVTGQPLDAAPSPLALVPAMIHGPGCFVPSRGVVGDRRAASRAPIAFSCRRSRASWWRAASRRACSPRPTTTHVTCASTRRASGARPPTPSCRSSTGSAASRSSHGSPTTTRVTPGWSSVATASVSPVSAPSR